MKKYLLIFGAAVLLSRFAAADVVLEMRLEYSEYLQYEKIQVIVSVVNDTEYWLNIDGSNTNRESGLRFLIKRNKTENVKRINALPIIDLMELPPGGKTEYILDPADWYALGLEGNYEIAAELYGGERKWLSNRARLDIVKGIETASVERAVPGDPDRIRKYSIRYWTRKGREYLFLRIDEEASQMVYGVYMLGSVVRVFKPQIEADRRGNVIVFHQTAKNRYTRTIFKSEPYSVRFVDQIYLDEKGKPLSGK